MKKLDKLRSAGWDVNSPHYISVLVQESKSLTPPQKVQLYQRLHQEGHLPDYFHSRLYEPTTAPATGAPDRPWARVFLILAAMHALAGALRLALAGI